MLVRRGDGAAWQVLVGRHRAGLTGLCRQVLGSDAHLADVVQDAVAAAHVAMAASRGPVNARPWLYRHARDHALALAHARVRTAATAPPAARAARGRGPLLEDLGRLPEVQRTALFLRETERLSYDDAADALGTGVRAVQEHLVRARIALAGAAVERGAAGTGPAVRTHRWRGADGARLPVVPTRRGS